MVNAEWINRYVSIEKEGATTYGTEPGGSPTYGEVDDESFKQTFDLLVRSDMSRQVASKAVTNTKYGEGSINFAVQPDDFMGTIMSSLLPVTTENTFWDTVAFAAISNQVDGRGYGYTETQNTMKQSSETIGYWEVRNGAIGSIDGAYDAQNSAAPQGSKIITLHSNNEAAVWANHNGLAVTATNLGYGILGSPTDGTANNGCYFTYTGVSNATLTGVKTYGVDNTFTNVADGGASIADDTVCLQYENYNNGIEPGKIYGYVTVPGSGRSNSQSVVLTGESAARAATGGTNAGAVTTVNGGANKHVFTEPVTVDDGYPSFTIRVGRESKEHTFTGMVSTRLSLSANLNEYVMASVDWLGQAEKKPVAIQTGVSFSGNDVDALHFSGAELYVDGSLSTSTKVQSISLEININRDLDSAYAVGSNTIQRIPPSRTREITGSMEFNEIIYADTTETKGDPTYEDLAGAKDSGGTEVHKLHGGAGRPALILKFQDATDADHMEITLYNVRFEAPEASVSGRDPARMSVNFQAFYDSKALGSAKAIMVKMKGAQLKTGSTY